jgi:phosphopantetheinyl transferase (holo-ACP synthase)
VNGDLRRRGATKEVRFAQAVGNDVVDLDDPAILEHHRRERFVSRVCAPEERVRVGSALDLWTLFAAKEAAYKALVKLGPSPGFRHREIVVSEDRRAVIWRGHVLAASVTSCDEYVHAIAWSAGAYRPSARVERARTSEGDAARALLVNLLAAATHCEADDLAVVRDESPGAWDGLGPPRVEHRGMPMDIDVSLSHDGRFVAVAALLGRGALGAGPLRVDWPSSWQGELPAG